jgi:16S rRNA (cytosine967-C5)-methyltransferase
MGQDTSLLERDRSLFGRNTRGLALTALTGILFKGAHPKETLERLAGELSRRDRGFLMELTYGVLRQKLLLDWLLSGFLRKRPPERTMLNLLCAAYQIFFMRVPERAAVFESVRIEKDKGGKPELVNAILRNLGRQKDSLKGKIKGLEETAKDHSGKPAERAKCISLLTSHPLWLVKRYAKRLGMEGALDLALANNKIPPLTLRVNPIKGEREKIISLLKEKGFDPVPTDVSPYGIKLHDGIKFFELDYLYKVCTPQDEAAQIVTLALDPRPGERILDGCAAPGGKTTHVAELMKDRGEVIAMDMDEGRMEKLRENMERLTLKSIKPVIGDLAETDPSEWGLFDRVLVDAPCSSLGVIRRNPDIKWRHSEKDLPAYKGTQMELLQGGARLLKPDGILVFSTCSTEPEEGEEVIKEFLGSKEGANFRTESPSLPILSPLMEDSFLRSYPHRDDMDGFFIARMRRG